MTLEQRIRRSYEDFNERGLDWLDDFWHPDIEYHEAPDFPGGGTYRGREAVRARLREYVEVLGDVRCETGRIEVEGDRAVWEVRYIGRTAEGLPHAHTWGYVGRFEGELLIECRAHYDATQAFEAFGSSD